VGRVRLDLVACFRPVGPGWVRDPELFETMRTAFSLVMQRSTGVGVPPSTEQILSAFEAFGLEDDGSTEWNYMLDLIGMITPVLSNQDVGTCLDAALRFYLDGAFNMRARVYAVANGKPISVTEVRQRIADDPEWERAVNFIIAL
jgi:hypothetical protein